MWVGLLNVLDHVLDQGVVRLYPFNLLGVAFQILALIHIERSYCAYLSLYSFKTRFPQYCPEPKLSSTCLCGFVSKVTQAIKLILSEMVLNWLKTALPRFASRMSFVLTIPSCIGLRSSANSLLFISAGFLAFEAIRRNRRCPSNALLTLAAYIPHQFLYQIIFWYSLTCLAIGPPRASLNATYFLTVPFKYESNSSTASGNSSWTGFGG